ncbi:MAG: stage 0 sporulation family protein [Candidatus Omnitrophica bacterium]|jgi:cell fate regulator YaaT (PSP1 superfamily)|nr:stage 0 sporulation family protein [Candidatus Omnitrophota bacterium]
MESLIFVRLRDSGQVYPYNSGGLKVKEGDYVVVEHDRGQDYGQVVTSGEVACVKDNAAGQAGPSAGQVGKEPPKRILRLAKDTDIRQIEENRLKAKEVFNSCVKKIEEHKLDMKLVQAEYSFDRSKIVFYFTANGRVDFRNLVKDLAKIFKARIELRQIGVRDEARLFGGFGPCGRELCCARFLKDFEPVTIKMAKEEGLPLNPPKISGICGRLMCCLSFEYESYKLLSKGLPREGEHVHTPQGKGKVMSINVFKRTASVQLEDGTWITVSYKDKEHGK